MFCEIGCMREQQHGLGTSSSSIWRPLGQPDIEYAPNYEKYVARTKQRLSNKNLEQSLPPGFPIEPKSDLVWEGASLEARYNWTYELSEKDLEEIEDALQHFKSRLRVYEKTI
jgi:hypothetical protein